MTINFSDGFGFEGHLSVFNDGYELLSLTGLDISEGSIEAFESLTAELSAALRTLKAWALEPGLGLYTSPVLSVVGAEGDDG